MTVARVRVAARLHAPADSASPSVPARNFFVPGMLSRPIAHTSNVPNRGEPEIRKALGQVSVSRKPPLPAIPRSRAHLTPEAYPRSSYALHTHIHLSLNPLPPERESNDSLDTSKAPRRMDGSMLRRGDENRAVTPGKTMRAVRHLPSRFRERVSAHVRPFRTRARPRMSREHVARPTSPARRPRAGSGNPTIGRVGTSATRISSRDSPASLPRRRSTASSPAAARWIWTSRTTTSSRRTPPPRTWTSPARWRRPPRCVAFERDRKSPSLLERVGRPRR